MKRIAVLTSGGDAPGMNAAIRAVVRSGLARDWEVIGIRNGFAGLLDAQDSGSTPGDQFQPLQTRDVSGIIQQGGTMLGSARCQEFRNTESQLKAVSRLAA